MKNIDFTIEEKLDYNQNKTGVIHSESPSNIAIVKYWGKLKNQIPTNTSISFTLKNCKTKTTLKYNLKKENNQDICVKVFFENKENQKFKEKIVLFFDKIKIYCPYIVKYDFKIHTQNTFPHSSGIASSASGMSALALCIIDLECKLLGIKTNKNTLKKASFLSRLGSGSACRSVYKGIVSWGKHPKIENSSDLFATKLESKVHDNFKDFQDTILLIEHGQKQISSTVGHSLMDKNPFSQKRFEIANSNITEFKKILQSGDLQLFGELLESEALMLHAMMMCSKPYFLLLKPNTLAVIEKVFEFRNTTQKHLYFTLDAGANIHLIYPKKESDLIVPFIENELSQFCENRKFIMDEVDF